ncbi:cytochrome P450 4c3-like [Phymastichus coffea]|uniref:cytochrome P450 4c3-like n=1 Tax=Phymastichus coffea TaxID=108790 RepID=UPI00273CC60E|nr:cytochrome P450 4c3-like [Phymastichus coffea]
MTSGAEEALAAGGASWTALVLWSSLMLALCVSLTRRARFVHALRSIPSPSGALPFLGNAMQLNCSLEDFFKKLVQWSKEFGDIYLVWVGSRPFIFLYRVESVQPLLSSSQHIDKSLEYQYLKPWLRDGLITSGGAKWRSRRKFLTPIFHSEMLRDYFGVAAREARVFVKCLRSELGKPEFDVIPYAKRAALDVICECAIGHNIHTQTNYKNEYHSAVQSITTISQIRFTNIWISNDFIFKKTALGKEHDRALNVIHSFVNKVIAERKLARSVRRDANSNSQSRRAETLLDMLLERTENGEQLTDEEILEEVNTFMFAGHDTVGTSVSWTLYALGRQPEYQDKIVQEYEEIFGPDREEIDYDELHKLVWLDACIKETWRVYPTAPLIARQIYNPITLQGTEIPVGSTVLVNSYLLHRDPRYFPEPEAYRPERFLPGQPKAPTFAYIPFSAGSRNCIGSKFATFETKLTLLALLRAYRFHAIDREDQLRFVSQIVLDNVGGIRLSITPRQ